jgi:hypothetical protein
MKLIKIAKFVLPSSTYTCGYCSGKLDVIDVIKNPKHFFNPGQLFSCSCSKSQVWTNSVRRIEDLIDYCDNKPTSLNPEQYGFCCDKFCPKCWNSFLVIRNSQLILDNKKIENSDLGGEVNIQELVDQGRLISADIHGCSNCLYNQFLIHQGVGSEGGEYDGQKSISQWFKSNQNMWRNSSL